jgi:hypothetical protein
MKLFPKLVTRPTCAAHRINNIQNTWLDYNQLTETKATSSIRGYILFIYLPFHLLIAMRE